MANIFKQLMMPKVPQSMFDLSHDVKATLEMGRLVPTCVLEALPGDKFTINTETLMRMAPMVSPVMHHIQVYTHFFFVPNRILWAGWEDFITGGDDGQSAPAPPHINVGQGNIQPGDLGNYLGIVPAKDAISGSVRISALPVAAYYKIYDDYYRDQDLQDETFVPLVNGYNVPYNAKASADPLRRAWNHDYFTSCRPYAQKGDAVTLPLFDEDSINANVELNPNSGASPLVVDTNTQSPLQGSLDSSAAGVFRSNSTNAQLDPNGTLEVDLDLNAESATINTLRRAFRLQEWLEKNARGGSRYVEHLWNHFKTRSSDKRLQRAEYLGGSSGSLVISEVLATAETRPESQTIPLGNLGGHGINVTGGRPFTYHCEEHGFIMGITSVRPRTSYYQGLHKMFTRFDKLDYAFPTFANIGEQEVKVSEIYMDVDTVEELDEVFGYAPRYSEYKFMNGRVVGAMADTAEFWHLGRKFDNKPALNSDFIECDPSNRIFAVDDDQHLFAQFINNIRVLRKLPKYGIPSL